MIGRSKTFAIGVWFMMSLVCRADEPVDFHNDVIPLLTKHGCNAGACHGAAIGRGGFKLSLYGGDPLADYDAIVRQVEGRRINLDRPDDSLILLKPAEQLEHGGGSVFDLDSESAGLLVNWIAQGGTQHSTRQLERVEISPQSHVVRTLGEELPLHATAHYSDGTRRDVTKWAVFTAEDSSAVHVDSKTATARLLRRGRHVIVARYLSEVVPIELIAPISDEKVDLSSQVIVNFIDEEVLNSLATLGVPPSSQADEATLLRRLTLDLTGRLPSRQRVEAVREDGLHSNVAIEELLASDEFSEYWTLQLAKLLRIRPRNNDLQAMSAYHGWLTEQVRRDVSYKQIAEDLLMASGDSHKHGAANFFRTTMGAREQAEFVSELFMGSRMRCANCHNHPLDRWTQDDYHGLAAIFATVDGDQVVADKPAGFTVHPRTLQPARARIPGDRFLDNRGVDSRMQLTAWLTDMENPYFAKAIVNRLWKSMMGRGLVEPVDDFRDTNPATHPKLLRELADDFVANGYRLRHTLGLIARSATYGRSANANEKNKNDAQFYSHALRRTLEPEVLADAIADVIGVAEDYGDRPNGTRAVSLVDPTVRSLTLDVLGRCGREASCETAVAATDGLPQKLHLFNGELLNARISAEGSRLQRLLASGVEPIDIVSEFYLVALSREPTAEESRHWKSELDRLATASERAEFLQDFVWGLLASRDFTTNH